MDHLSRLCMINQDNVSPLLQLLLCNLNGYNGLIVFCICIYNYDI